MIRFIDWSTIQRQTSKAQSQKRHRGKIHNAGLPRLLEVTRIALEKLGAIILSK